MGEQSIILIADREVERTHQLSTILESTGYRVQTTTTGRDALSQINTSPPILMMCHVDLGDLSGYDLCEHLKSSSVAMPIILIGSLNDNEIRSRTFQVGAVDYICYPFQADEILARLQTHLNISYWRTEVPQDDNLAQMLALVVQETANSIIITDKEGKIEWVNNGFTRMTEYTLDEVQGKTPGSILQGDGTDLETIQMLGQAIKAGKSCRTEILNYTKSGGAYWVEAHIEPVYKAGLLDKFIAIQSDITERINSEDVRREAETLRVELTKEHELRQLKSAFITMVSHEFRTPLAVIQAASETLQRYADRLSEDQRQKRLIKIHDQISILTAIMNDVLIVNEIGSSVERVDTTPLNPVDLCREIIDKYIRLGIRQDIHFQAMDEHAHYPLNPILMREIIEKLLSNAIKYSPEADVIDVKVMTEGKYLKLIVRDYGIGIPEDDQQHIFTEFYRASNVENIHGTGLGLSIVKYAVEAQGGIIQFESKVSDGSNFTVTFPIVS